MKSFKFTFAGNPIPFKRPRFNNGRGFNDPAYTEYKEALAHELRKCRLGLGDFLIPEMLTGELRLTCIFYRENKRPVDLDNLCKTLLDAIQDSQVIKNDAQIFEVYAKKFLGSKVPRVTFELEEIER